MTSLPVKTRFSRTALIVCGVTGVLLAAGCGGGAPVHPRKADPVVGQPVSLNTSVASASATWAVVVMGGSSAQLNNFWQVFVRPSGATAWKLVTPPGVADNGGLVLTGQAGRSAAAALPVTVGFRPSLWMTFTPLTASQDNGQTWTSGNPVYAVIANVPDSLAAQPEMTQSATARMLALATDGTVRAGLPDGSTWTTVTSLKSLANSATGRQCGLANLTGIAYTPSGVALVAGTCTRPGVVGIVAQQSASWSLAGPALPGALAGQPVTVIALNQFPGAQAASGSKTAGGKSAGGIMALLEVGPPKTASLVTIWSADNGGHWQVSQPYPLAGAKPGAASFGPSGLAAVVLTGGSRGSGAASGVSIAGPGSAWQSLPALPPGTEVLAVGPAGQPGSIQALAVKRSVLTVWQAGPGAAAWNQVQVATVPIQYGSSG